MISVPGIAARGDLTFLQLGLGYLVGRIAVAWWLLPGYFTGQQQTAYERLQARFGVRTRQLLSAVFVVVSAAGLLYQVNQVIHRLRTDMHIEGAYLITMGVLVLFWNLLSLLMRLNGRD